MANNTTTAPAVQPITGTARFWASLESAAGYSILRSFARYIRRDTGAQIVRARLGDYFDVRQDGLISYNPTGTAPEVDPETGKWKRAGRRELRPSKFLTMAAHSIQTRPAAPVYIEFFTNCFKAAKEVKVAETAGEINTAYSRTAHFSSCMHDDSVGDFYAALGVKCLWIEKDGQPAAKALLWPSVTITQGYDPDNVIVKNVPFLDRQYYGDSAHRRDIVTFARENYRAWTREQSGTDTGWRISGPHGAEIDNAHITSQVPDKPGQPFNMDSFDFYPYVDTLPYFNDMEEPPIFHSGRREYTDHCQKTDGTTRERDNREDEHEGEVFVDGEWYPEDEVVTLANGEFCHQDNARWCEVTEEYYHEDDTFYSIRIRGTYYTFHEDALDNA
jgi:hypothetical protein